MLVQLAAIEIFEDVDIIVEMCCYVLTEFADKHVPRFKYAIQPHWLTLDILDSMKEREIFTRMEYRGR